MSKQLNTNEDLVRDLMNYSPRGALAQAFIMHAIQHYARECIKSGSEKFDSNLVNGKAWIEVAVDVNKRCEAFYGRHDAKQG